MITVKMIIVTVITVKIVDFFCIRRLFKVQDDAAKLHEWGNGYHFVDRKAKDYEWLSPP